MTPEGESFLKRARESNKLANVHLINQTTQVRGIHTVIRDASTSRAAFVFQTDRLIRMVVEEALSLLPTEEKVVTTPTGASYHGLRFTAKLCAVSIPRSGDTMENGVRQVIRDVRIGKILIQRNEETAKPHLLYAKLPDDIAKRHVILLDPMLATGGTAIMAIDVLVSRGVSPKNIIFANLIAAPEGITALVERFPDVQIVTSAIDDRLNEKAYIIPGLGDLGDRFFGTDH